MENKYRTIQAAVDAIDERPLEEDLILNVVPDYKEDFIIKNGN